MQVRKALVAVTVLATCRAAGQTPQHTIYYNPPAGGAPPEDILQIIRQSQNPHFQARNAGYAFTFTRHDTGPHHALGSVPSSAQTSAGDPLENQTSAGDNPLETKPSDSALSETHTAVDDLPEIQSSSGDLLGIHTSSVDLSEARSSTGDYSSTQTYAVNIVGAQPLAYLSGVRTSAGALPDTQISAGALPGTLTFPEERLGNGTSSGGPPDNMTSADEISDSQSSAIDLLFTATPVSDLLETQTAPGDPLGTQIYTGELLGAQMSHDDVLDNQTSASDLQDTQTSESDLPETQTILNDITQTQTFANDLLETQTLVDDLSDTKTSARILLEIQATKSDFLDINSSGYDPTYFHTSDVSHIPFSHSDSQTSVDELENPASGPLLLTTEVSHPSTTTLGQFPDTDELLQTTTLPSAETTASFRTTTDGTSEIMKGKDKETKQIREKAKVRESVDHMQNTLNFAFEKVKRKPEPLDVPLGRSVDSRTYADYPAEHRGGQNNIYQYHFQDPEAGSYKFGFGDDNQWRHEERRSDGVVVGRYGWHDASGKHHVTHYVSDVRGYRVVRPGDKVLLHAPDPTSTTATQSPTTPTRPPSTYPPPTAKTFPVFRTSMPTNPPPTTTSTPTDETPTTTTYSSEITSLPTSPSPTSMEPTALPSSQQHQLSESYPGKPEDLLRPSLPASEFMGRPPITYPLPQQQPGSKRPDSWLHLSPTPSPRPVWVRPRPDQSNRLIPSPFRPVNQPRPPLFSSPKPLKPLLSYLSLPRPKPGLLPKPNDRSPSDTVQASDEILKPGSSEAISDSSEFVHHFRPKKPLHSRKPIRNQYPPITWPRPYLQPVRRRPLPSSASDEYDGSGLRPPSVSPFASSDDEDDGQEEAPQSESTDFTANLVSHQESGGYTPTGRPSHQPGHKLGSVIRRPQPHPDRSPAQTGRPTLYAPATSLIPPGLGVNIRPQENRPLSPVPGSSSVADPPEAQSSPSQSVAYAVRHGSQTAGQKDPQKHPLDYAFMDEDYNLLEASSAVSDNTDDKVQLQQSTEENADDLRSQTTTKDHGVTTNETVASEEDSQRVAAVDPIGQDTITRPTADDYSSTSGEADTTVDPNAATTDHQDSGGHQEHILVTTTELSTPDDGVTQYTTTSNELVSSTAEESTSEAPNAISTSWDSLTTDTEWPYFFQQPSTIPQPELPTFPPLSPQNFWTDLLQQIYNLPNLVPERIRPTLQ